MVDPISIFLTVASMAASMAQAQKQARAQQQAAQQAANQAAKERWEAYEAAEKKRKDDLKKALAKRRAAMGAKGLSSADGSAGAIIQGLRTDKAEMTHEDYQNAQDGINDNISSLHSNLLESSEKRNRALYGKVGSAVSSIGGSLLGETKQEQQEISDQIGTVANVAGSFIKP